MKPIHLIQVKQIITWILAMLFQESFDWQQRSPAKSNRTPLGPYVSLHLTVQELSVGYTEKKGLANSWIYVNILRVFNISASCFKVKCNYIV